MAANDSAKDWFEGEIFAPWWFGSAFFRGFLRAPSGLVKAGDYYPKVLC